MLSLVLAGVFLTAASPVSAQRQETTERMEAESESNKEDEAEESIVKEKTFIQTADYLEKNIRSFHLLPEGDKRTAFLSRSGAERYFFLRAYTFYFAICAERENILRLSEEGLEENSTRQGAGEELQEKLYTCLYVAQMYHESIQTEEAETEFAEAEAALAEMTEAYQSGEEMYSQLKSLTDTYMCWRTYFAEEPEEEGMSALEREVLIPLTKVLIRLPDEAKKRQILAGFTSFMKEETKLPWKQEEQPPGDIAPREEADKEEAPKEELKTEFQKAKKLLASARASYKVGWNSDSTGWWYAYSTTAYYKNCWQYLAYNGVYDWYYFKDNGYIATNTWVDSNNYVNGSGYCTTAGIGSFKTLQQAAGSGHCSTVRLTVSSIANEAELRIGKTMTVTTAPNSSGCTIYGTGLKRWVITGNVSLEGSLVFDGQKDKVADDVTSNLFVKTGGTLCVKGSGVCIQNSIGHGIYGEVRSLIIVESGSLRGNYHDGVGSYGTVQVSGGKFYENDTGLYIAGTYEGKRTGARGILTGGEFYRNQYGVASSEYAEFSVTNVSIHENYRYGFLLYPNGYAKLEGTPEIYGNHCGIYNFGELLFCSGNVRSNKNTGILNEGKYTMKNGTVSSNRGSDGGGITNKKEFLMESGCIKDNTASRGGGIFNQGAFTMTGGEVTGNQASQGGGICSTSSASRTAVSGGALQHNSGTKDGGGICILNGAACELSKSTLENNSAVRGGSVYLDGTLKAYGNPRVKEEVFLAPSRFITVTGSIERFVCQMASEDTFQGRVLAHYTLMPGDSELDKYSLEQKTQDTASGKLLVLESGSLELTPYAYSVYLNSSGCRIRYDANGGTGVMSSEVVSVNKKYRIRDNEFEREQAAFVGWSLVRTNSETGKLLYPMEEVFPERLLSMYPFTEAEGIREITLYAIWDYAPSLEVCGNEFYEGEEVRASQLKKGILRGMDTEDGDITDKIEITQISYGRTKSGYQGENQEFVQGLPDSYILDTYQDRGMEKGERITDFLLCKAEDSAGNVSFCEMPVSVVYNEPPVITVPKRVILTTDEAGEGRVSEEVLLNYVSVKDKEDDMAKAAGVLDRDGQVVDIRRYLMLTEIKDADGETVSLEQGLLPGEYTGEVIATDRFGKTCVAELHIAVADTKQEPGEEADVRFISLEYLDTLAEDSHWSRSELEERLKKEEPEYTFSLTYQEIQEIKKIAGDYGKDKEGSEKAIREVMKKWKVFR